jgi:crotonobetainyl-CoA:carnitine CoA-transferase CaiB-like acyl-CoA transferase
MTNATAGTPGERIAGGGPLHGVRVVDLGHYVAGPLAAVLLADQGAEVVRIDRPGSADRPADAFLQRGKRRITLDLKQPGDRARARELINHSDVLIENFRPGVLDRLGLSYAHLAAANPGLVYLSLPGFGRTDPRAAVPAWEGVVSAATANTWLRWAPESWDTSVPSYSALPIASNLAAFVGAHSVVAALIARHRTGRGERIEVPLHDAMFELVGPAGMHVADRGMVAAPHAAPRGSGTYQCADGRWVRFDPFGSSARFLAWLLDVAGEPALAVRAMHVDRDPAVLAEVRSRLPALFALRPAQEWDTLANEAGVPLSMVRTSAEWLDNAHARASQQVIVVDDPMLGQTTMAGRVLHMSAAPGPLPAPRRPPDSDRSAILGQLATGLRWPAAGEPGGLPYDDLKVVDLTQVYAGPSAGRILAEFGAQVTKVNPPHRTVLLHGTVNRGKESILLDLETPGGQDVLWLLLEQADVVLQNFPKSTIDGYTLGYEHVRSRNPGVVYVSLSCYGGPGPWLNRRGYETQAQAATGIMERHGRGDAPGIHGPYNLVDFGAGVITAFAAAVALYHRIVTGEGQHVMTSLTQVATLHQATRIVRYPGSTWTEPAGRAALGESPLQRLYHAADRWMYLGASEADRGRLAESLGLADLAGGPGTGGEALAGRVAEVLRGLPAEHWVGLLQRAGLGAHEVLTLSELVDDKRVRARGLMVTQTSEEVGDVVVAGVPVSFASSAIRPGHPAPQPGADGAAVLARLGLADRAGELERSWAVQLHDWPGGWD